MTRGQLDRAILKLFREEQAVIPRTAFSSLLYAYAYDLWSRTREGQREVRRRYTSWERR